MGRILVVEDEPGARLLLQSRLEDLGHEVATVPTGAMGLMEARAGHFDLFLVDVVLGQGVDGLEVTRRLKAMPHTHGVPVVLISGQSTAREDLHRGYEAGCEAFLIKSDLSLLEDVVRAMLRIKSLQDDLSMQNHLLEQQNHSLQEEKQRGADLELALRESGVRSLVFRELAAGRPDGVVLVDGEGVVRSADRGARDILGKDLEGRSLGRLAPASRLEAFVRDARTEPREGFRFDIGARGAHGPRSLSASVLPLVAEAGGLDKALRAVLLLDAGKRRVAAEMLRMQEQGIPRREIGPLLEAARRSFHPGRILGSSEAITELREIVFRVARTDSPVLLRGEPGVGKGLVARTLHFGGDRSGPYVPVNCSAHGPSALASELFGHVKGAFEGAFSDRPGQFHQAHMGTLFLDEVADLTPELQANLLTLLQGGDLCRVGSDRGEHVDVRVIAATSHDLQRRVDEGEFNRELLVQLSAVDVVLPPLRERPGDVLLLAEHFVRRYAADRAEIELSPEALLALEHHAWPENVRELELAIERACALCSDAVIGVEHLGQVLEDVYGELSARSEIPAAQPRVLVRPGIPVGTSARRPVSRPLPTAAVNGLPDAPSAEPSQPLRDSGGEDFLAGEASLDRYERAALLHALYQTGGDRLAAARLLGVGKSTLYRKLKRHAIQ